MGQGFESPRRLSRLSADNKLQSVSATRGRLVRQNRYGSVSRAAKGTDCKSVGVAFAGSSPARPTSLHPGEPQNEAPLGVFNLGVFHLGTFHFSWKVGNPPAGCHFRYQNTRFLKANPRIVQPAGGSPTQLKHTRFILVENTSPA